MGVQREGEEERRGWSTERGGKKNDEKLKIGVLMAEVEV